MNNNFSELISSTYRIIGEIGAGGGGVVYLAEHLRLNKKVVLKVDKRSISAKPEVLRREVDALKDLSHTYIPQVYDFIIENETVYTVMDYIEGESLDRPLKRNEKFSQAQIVQWTCQLLEALSYLHSRPPHGILHADIKPANIMIKPQGDIVLIDFNIALALGEEGAVAVGRSFGYASPEHYEFSNADNTRSNSSFNNDISFKKQDEFDDVTILGDETQFSKDVSSTPNQILKENSSSSKSGKDSILLDVRSDIYSLGATMYHMITGKRPPKDIKENKDAFNIDYNSAIVNIVKKAMQTDPNMRYQSADEMLFDLENLREKDSRTKRYKRTKWATIFLLSVIFGVGLVSVFTGQRILERLQNSYVLSEYSANYLEAGDVQNAVKYALDALPKEGGIFDIPLTANAQKALTNALNIYDLDDGFEAYGVLELPSAPLQLEISPNAETAIAVYAGEMTVFELDNISIIKTFSMEKSALAQAKYIDENTIVYSSPTGIKFYSLSERKELWSKEKATYISISEDRQTLATVYKDESTVYVYDVATGNMLKTIDLEGKKQSITVNDSFVDPGGNILALNEDGTLLGMSFSDGSVVVFDIYNSENNIEIFDDTSTYSYFQGDFHNEFFAFSATNEDNSVFAVIDTLNAVQTGGFSSEYPFSVKTDENGIYLQTENILVEIDPLTGDQIPLVNMAENITNFVYDGNHTLVSAKDSLTFFNRNAQPIKTPKNILGSSLMQIEGNFALSSSMDSSNINIVKLQNHVDAEIFSYDPSYLHNEARISADGSTIMLFSYTGFKLFDIDGEVIKDFIIPNAEQIYDQQYRRDEQGSRLDVIYNDGTIHGYSAETGELLYEEKGEKPDLSLHEEFFTSKLRIESPLHETPKAYDIETGKLIKELEKDDYLTYVTEVGAYVITEYISEDSERYGLLLNENCETLAYLPYLCDVVDEELIFDYPIGNLRKSRIYNIGELVELAHIEIEGSVD